MSIETLCRGAFVLACAILVSGCSSPASPWSSPNPGPVTAPSSSRTSLECRVTNCLYDGKYEPNERSYAEDEAKRLNRAELDRLRRAMGN